jgi:peptidoglycan/LPS O-acetylase OafA/YrhL
MLVILSHVSVGAYYQYGSTFGRTESIIQQMLLLGHLGVTVFFVISGYLITSLLLREDRVDLKKFYFRRTLRIFPPYYFYLFVILLISLAGYVGLTPYNMFAAFTYTRNYFFNNSVPDAWYLAHTWSLAVEEQFYLLFPVSLLILGRKRGHWVALAAIVAAPLFRFYYLTVDQNQTVEFSRFETVVDSLAIGCLLAFWQSRLHSSKAYRSLSESKLVILLPIIALMITWLGHFPKFYDRALYGLLALTIQNVCIALCIDWAVNNSASRPGRFLNCRPMIYLGMISYSVYLWQQPFLNPELRLPLLVSLPLIFIVALISYYFVEQPALQLRQKLERGWGMQGCRVPDTESR